MGNLAIIGDHNYRQFIHPMVNGERKMCACVGMWKPSFAHAQVKGFAELESVPLIPRTEWDDRIEQLEKDKATQRHLMDDCGMKALDQNGTNYCWVFGPTTAAMICRLKETGKVVPLSATSAGARIKNFANVGGWGSEALDHMVEFGLNEQSDWPQNRIRREFDTDESREKALRHRVVEYYKLDTWDEVVSCILSGVAVAVGYNWWRHEVCGIGLQKRTHDLDILNSWGADWSDNGYGRLTGSKKYPDDAVAIVSMTAA